MVVRGAAPLGEVEVRLEQLGSDMAVSRASAIGDGDTLEVRLSLDVEAVAASSKERQLWLVATAADAPTSPARARVVSGAQLQLLMALERQLLFAGFRTDDGSVVGSGVAGADSLRRVLSLVEASLLQKLRSGAGLTASVAADVDGGGGLDSASESFASMLDRLRRAAGFSSAPWHEASELEWAEELTASVDVIQAELRDSLSHAPESPTSGWESADYEAIAPDWKVQHLWQVATPATRAMASSRSQPQHSLSTSALAQSQLSFSTPALARALPAPSLHCHASCVCAAGRGLAAGRRAKATTHRRTLTATRRLLRAAAQPAAERRLCNHLWAT